MDKRVLDLASLHVPMSWLRSEAFEKGVEQGMHSTVGRPKRGVSHYSDWLREIVSDPDKMQDAGYLVFRLYKCLTVEEADW